MILNLIRFPLACIGQAIDIGLQMRATNKMLAEFERFADRVPVDPFNPPDLTDEERAAKARVRARLEDSATAAAGADSTHPTPRGASNDPAGVLPPVTPAGSLQLAELIVGVMFEHDGYTIDLEKWFCSCGEELTADMRPGFAHRYHVGAELAERIETASPAVDLTFDDLAEAACIIRDHYRQSYAVLGDGTDAVRDAFALANRLTAAAKVAPTP